MIRGPLERLTTRLAITRAGSGISSAAVPAHFQHRPVNAAGNRAGNKRLWNEGDFPKDDAAVWGLEQEKKIPSDQDQLREDSGHKYCHKPAARQRVHHTSGKKDRKWQAQCQNSRNYSHQARKQAGPPVHPGAFPQVTSGGKEPDEKSRNQSGRNPGDNGGQDIVAGPVVTWRPDRGSE